MHDRLEKISVAMTRWIGTPASLLVHTVFFAASFTLISLGYSVEQVLLVLTTAVSLEAIYLAVFIQMTVNRQAEQIEDVGEDIEDIQEEVKDLGADVDEISEDLEKMQEEQTAEDANQEAATLENIQAALHKLMQDIEILKSRTHHLHPASEHPNEPAPARPSASGDPQNYFRKLMGLISLGGTTGSGSANDTSPSDAQYI